MGAFTDVSVIATAFGGTLWGILGGALPGISPSIAMALLLPFTYGMEPIPAIVLLASVYVGAEYGGSIPAILIRTPGTNAAAATTLDGYEMARQGRGRGARHLARLGTGGRAVRPRRAGRRDRAARARRPRLHATRLFRARRARPVGDRGTRRRGAHEGLIAASLGLMIATVGTDPVSGVPRFTFGSPELLAESGRSS